MQQDAASKMAEVKSKIDRRGDDVDADLATFDADMAEADAVAAIDHAGWAIDNARLTTVYALDSERVHSSFARSPTPDTTGTQPQRPPTKAPKRRAPRRQRRRDLPTRRG